MPIGMSRLRVLRLLRRRRDRVEADEGEEHDAGGAQDAHEPPKWCVTPCASVYVLGGGMYGVWFAGLMKPQPNAMNRMTIATLVMTMMPLTTRRLLDAADQQQRQHERR